MSVELQIADGVARVRLNRPERLNAVDQETERKLEAAWTEINSRADVRCAVLTGTGRAFCAGADMKEEGPGGLEYWSATGRHGFAGIACGRRLNCPLVARVNGFALGGGFEAVLGCDIVIAAESAFFGLPEPRVGRLPLDGMIVLPRVMPRTLAMGMLLTGRRVSAAEAEGWGLINEVVPDDSLDEAVENWVGDILKCAPLSLKAIKRCIDETQAMDIAQARRHLSVALAEALGSRDAQEGVAAFREKRPAEWTGT